MCPTTPTPRLLLPRIARCRFAKDLSHERPKRRTCRRGQTDTSLACRPDSNVDCGVEEVANVIEAADEWKANNGSSRTTDNRLASGGSY
jgi:hypothetical protein